jgi:phosphoenolpyruvate carboxylase
MQRLFAILSILGAVLFAQVPELLQQYRQRLGGAADELTVIVRNFDEDSRRSGYDRAGALGVMAKNTEQLMRDQALRMTEYVRRLDRLNEQQSALANGVTPAAVVAVAIDYDKPIMAQAWKAYAPALPTSLTGIVFAIIGWCLSYGAFLLLGALVGSRSKVAA